jgi:hypothetical protein
MNWRTKGALASIVVVMVARAFEGCGSSECAVQCRAGTVPDQTGCACVQGGPECGPSGPEPVQDGGALLGNCCPRDVLQSTSRVPPMGACSGSVQCFVAVHQVCSGATGATGPVDEYACTCDGTNWQCSRTAAGSGACPPSDDAGTGND